MKLLSNLPALASFSMSTSQHPETIAERFALLADTWRNERGVTSSVAEMSMHRAYQQIIGLGPDAIPLILAELERRPDHWFWALASLTGESPVPETARGNLQAMTEAWLVWGRARGYSW